MKKVFLTLAMVMIAFTTFAQEVTKNVDIPGHCDRIKVANVFKVDLKQGPSSSAKIVVSKEIEQYVIAKIIDGRFYLGLDYDKMPRSLRNNAGSRTCEAYITMNSVSDIEMSGASKMKCSGTFQTNEFDLELSGASRVEGLVVNGSAGSFEVSGASSLEANGKFSYLDFDLSGASRTDSKINATNAEFDVSGASRANISGTFDSFEIECNGASSAHLEGSANVADLDCSGSSHINGWDMTIAAANVEASGASSIDVNCTKSIAVDISSASTINYKAPDGVNPIIREVGGASRLNRR